MCFPLGEAKPCFNSGLKVRLGSARSVLLSSTGLGASRKTPHPLERGGIQSTHTQCHRRKWGLENETSFYPSLPSPSPCWSRICPLVRRFQLFFKNQSTHFENLEGVWHSTETASFSASFPPLDRGTRPTARCASRRARRRRPSPCSRTAPRRALRGDRRPIAIPEFLLGQTDFI